MRRISTIFTVAAFLASSSSPVLAQDNDTGSAFGALVGGLIGGAVGAATSGRSPRASDFVHGAAGGGDVKGKGKGGGAEAKGSHAGAKAAPPRKKK